MKKQLRPIIAMLGSIVVFNACGIGDEPSARVVESEAQALTQVDFPVTTAAEGRVYWERYSELKTRDPIGAQNVKQAYDAFVSTYGEAASNCSKGSDTPNSHISVCSSSYATCVYHCFKSCIIACKYH